MIIILCVCFLRCIKIILKNELNWKTQKNHSPSENTFDLFMGKWKLVFSLNCGYDKLAHFNRIAIRCLPFVIIFLTIWTIFSMEKWLILTDDEKRKSESLTSWLGCDAKSVCNCKFLNKSSSEVLFQFFPSCENLTINISQSNSLNKQDLLPHLSFFFVSTDSESYFSHLKW